MMVVLAAVALSGCYYDNAEDLYPVPADTTDTVVTFKGNIQPFITKTCAISSGCHSSGSNNPVLETYDQISSKADRIKARAIDSKEMPPAGNPKPTQKELDDFQKWMTEGKPNN